MTRAAQSPLAPAADGVNSSPASALQTLPGAASPSAALLLLPLTHHSIPNSTAWPSTDLRECPCPHPSRLRLHPKGQRAKFFGVRDKSSPVPAKIWAIPPGEVVGKGWIWKLLVAHRSWLCMMLWVLDESLRILGSEHPPSGGATGFHCRSITSHIQRASRPLIPPLPSPVWGIPEPRHGIINEHTPWGLPITESYHCHPRAPSSLSLLQDQSFSSFLRCFLQVKDTALDNFITAHPS